MELRLGLAGIYDCTKFIKEQEKARENREPE